MIQRKTALALAILSLSAALQAQQLPRKSAEFVINMPGGKPSVLLSSYKGKVIVFAGILTTCPHCQHTVGLLSKLQSELGPRGLQVVAFAAGQDSPDLAVPLFLKQFNPPFPVGYSNDVKAVLDYYQYSPNNLPHMPMLAFIDRQFTIRAQHEGGDADFFGEAQEANLRTQIEALLKEPAGAKKTVSKAATPKKGS